MLHARRQVQHLISVASPRLPLQLDQSSTDIMELLRHHRCRVLKRVPKASQLPAAEKLAEALRQFVAELDCVEKWLHLLTFSGFGIPGQRGGKRHLSSLASNGRKSMQP
jgi:hypothetical protein